MTKYMYVLLLSLSLPLIFSFWPPLKFYRSFRAYLMADAFILLIFGGWDVFAVSRGHWRFAEEAVYPFRIANLPLEEVLFFVVIPFCCIFTWEAILYLSKKTK